jgi:hypothetical protein
VESGGGGAGAAPEPMGEGGGATPRDVEISSAMHPPQIAESDE